MDALRQAQELGFLGEAPLESQVAHALGFVSAAEAAGLLSDPDCFLDLGSGGGVPGLVLAARWPGATAVLLDANERRCEALRRAVASAGWQERVRVVQQRAERAGRDPTLRSSQQLVVARSFGPPAVVAECAAPFLRVDGILVVSEPPRADELRAAGSDQGTGVPAAPASTARGGALVGHAERWPIEGLELLGLVPVCFHHDRFGYQVLRQRVPCPDRFPRREGIPAKRPLY